MAKIYVGAIDCSFNFCGCALLRYDEAKTKPRIETTRIIRNPLLKKSSSLTDLDRAILLYSGVKKFIDDTMIKPGIKIIAFEVPGGSQSQRAATCLGMAKGVIASVLSQLAFENYTGSWTRAPVMPNDVHKQVTGKNKATKDEIIKYVLKHYHDQVMFNNKKFIVYNHYDATTIDKYIKGDFEHIADAIIIAELGYKKLKESK